MYCYCIILCYHTVKTEVRLMRNIAKGTIYVQCVVPQPSYIFISRVSRAHLQKPPLFVGRRAGIRDPAVMFGLVPWRCAGYKSMWHQHPGGWAHSSRMDSPRQTGIGMQLCAICRRHAATLPRCNVNAIMWPRVCWYCAGLHKREDVFQNMSSHGFCLALNSKRM